MEAKKEQVETVIHGTFPTQQFFNTLARILSNKYNMDITAKVTRQNEKQQVSIKGGKE